MTLQKKVLGEGGQVSAHLVREGTKDRQTPQCGRPGFDPWVEKTPGEEAATYSSTLTWEIPQTEEPGGLQSMRSQRVGHD